MKVSYFTTCTGRLCDLQRALPKSIDAHAGDSLVEFVILNYGSRDGLTAWVQEKLAHLIRTGRVVYGEVDATHYRFGHSKNVAALLASGDLICSLDADNIAPFGFASHLRLLASSLEKPIITCENWIQKGDRLSAGECSGRKAFLRKQFIHLLRGYDERFDDWGADDGDITRRALRGGFQEIRWDHLYYKLVPQSSKVMHTKDPNRKSGLARNRTFRDENAARQIVAANSGQRWGVAEVRINFDQIVQTGE